MIDTTNMSIMANLIQPSSNVIASHMISKKDEDKDFSLNISELGVSSELFSSYDLDSNSLLNKSELATAIDSAMSQFDGEMPSKEDFQSVLSDFGFEAPSSTSNNRTLSSSQEDTISSVLENYDPNNLTKSDAKEIVSAFKEAGIRPSQELKEAMANEGFDAQEIGNLAEVEQAQGGTPPPPPPPPSSSSSEKEYDVMDTNEDGVVSQTELDEYYGTNESNTTSQSLNQQNSLDNLQLLMQTIKNSGSESVNKDDFDGLLKIINNQNNNSEINNFLDKNITSSVFDYA